MKKLLILLLVATSFISCKKDCWECDTPCGKVKICEVEGKQVQCSDGSGNNFTTFCTRP